MAASALLLPIATLFFFFSNLPNSLDAAGFSVDIIHRDSPKSPFYNCSESLFDRVSRAIQRSNSRVNYLISSTSAATPKDMSSIVGPDDWTYHMTISIGTPPLEILAIVDTGSDLIWTQCLPCKSCYKQDGPLFDPSKSSTYKDHLCNSSTCWEVDGNHCTNGSCAYHYLYGDDSHTDGILALETLAMNSSGTSSGRVDLPNITFGCGHDNGGIFDSQVAGIVGLGKGPLSLISQLGPSTGKKFAYCLVPRDQKTTTGRIDFGDSAVVSGNGTFYTPLISKPDFKKTFYYVNLKNIRVGDKIISFPSYFNGNIMLDSGTTLTYIPNRAYKSVLEVLKDAIHLQPVPDPSKNQLELCYEFGKGFKAPDMTFGFDGGEVVLGSLNTLIQTNENVSCFAFWNSDTVGILGNVAQQNIKIGYDLQNMKVAFKPTDCAHQ